MLKDLLVLLGTLVDQVGPIGIGIATFVESLIAPIPSEVILVFAGTNLKSWESVLLFTIAATIGSYFGTLPFYLISFKSKKLIYKLINKYGKYFFISTNDIERVEEKFISKGKLIVFTGRLIPGIRSLISIPAGISKMNFIEYTIYTLIGSFSWNSLLISGGFLLKNEYKSLLNYLDVYEKTTYIVLVLIILSIYIFLYIRHTKSK
ncbi:DedA family protein [Candidatus Dojkabacteria bacterium]|nr:DedA family protein [Candidatus Dojkabacteria bacterium]